MAVADPLYIMTRPMTFSSETLVTFMKSFKNLFPNPSYLIPQQHLNIPVSYTHLTLPTNREV